MALLEGDLPLKCADIKCLALIEGMHIYAIQDNVLHLDPLLMTKDKVGCFGQTL